MKRPPRLVLIKRPASFVKKDKELVTIETRWPSILAWAIDYPESKISDLYHRFGTDLDMSFKQFLSACEGRGLRKLMALASGKKGKKLNKITKTDSIQATESAIETFKANRKSEGFIHLGRMAKIVGVATKVIENESKGLSKMLDDNKGALAARMLDGHLDRTSKVDKLARSTFAIDSESNEDKAKANIAILMNFNPTPKQSNNDTVIDI